MVRERLHNEKDRADNTVNSIVTHSFISLVHQFFVVFFFFFFFLLLFLFSSSSSSHSYVLKRPGLDDFLRAVGAKFELIIFTASLAKVRLVLFLSSLPAL